MPKKNEKEVDSATKKDWKISKKRTGNQKEKGNFMPA